MSTISVIVATYNRKSLVQQTITNLLSQTMPPKEIIVVDDGSTDGSDEVIRGFGDKVILLRQQNRGPGAARNAGFAIATGDYIQFQDSDDLLALNKLKVQSELLDRTASDVAFGPWAHVWITACDVSFQTCVLQQRLPPDKISLVSWILRGWSTVLQSLLFRRSFLLGSSGFATDIRYGEDMEFLFRLLLRSPGVCFAGDTLTLYRLNSGSNLSQNTGAPQTRRVIDWGLCLLRITRSLEVADSEVDSFSRAAFQAAVRKHLRYLCPYEDSIPDLISDLSTKAIQLPDWLLGAIELWVRVAERARLARTGQRWLEGFQASPANQSQLSLIQALGFNTIN